MLRASFRIFATSNPSPACISAVKDAFRSGMHDGKTYSGSNGNLGATVAATLVHLEARSSGVTMWRTIHKLNAMAFSDARDGPLSSVSSRPPKGGKFNG